MEDISKFLYYNGQRYIFAWKNGKRTVNNQLVLKSTAGVVKNVAKNIGRDVAGDILMKPFPDVFKRYFRTK